MKKILALLLILVMAFCAVGCDLINGILPGGDVEENGPTLDDAKTYLFSTYKDSATSIPNDYDLVGKVIIDGVSFTVTWTVDLEVITIKESTKANFWTVDLPDTNATEVAYVLTATITDAAGNKVEVKFNKTLPVIDTTGVVTNPVEGTAYKLYFDQMNLGYTLFALNTTQKNEQKYIETTLDPKQAADFYVEAADGGYKIYTTINGVKNYVYAQGIANDAGKISKYIGFSAENSSVFTYIQDVNTWQVVIDNIKYGVGTYNAFETISISEFTYFSADKINVAGGQFPLAFMLSSYAETLTPDEKPVAGDPAANSTLTIAQAIELGNSKVKDQYTEGKYYVTGTVKEIQNATYGNLVITDGTNDLLIYGTYDADGANRFDAMASQPAVGDTITVYGIIGMYNAPQMKNGWIQGGNAPTAPEVVDPVAGTAYHLGMINTGAGSSVYYICGGMASTYYLATSANAADALKAYIEAVDGGYYLYVLDNTGAKLYINCVVSGTHVNAVYDATAATVYTYDAALQTLSVNVEMDGETLPYILGTRSDKTYTTVGFVKANYQDPFYCQFYTIVEGGNTDTTPDEPVNPSNPPVGTSAPEVGKGYTISCNNANGVVYFSGALEDARFAGTTNVAEAAVVYVEAGANDGEYLLYFDNNGTKTYIVIDDKAQGASFTTDAASATVLEWNSEKNTFAVADDANNRAFGMDATKTFTTFSTYDLSNAQYNWGQFAEVA